MAGTLSACIGGGGAPGVSNDAASLASIEIRNGTQVVGISPAFAAETTGYSVAVGGATTSVDVVAVTTDSKATLRINNTVVTSGQVAGPIALAPGSNIITIAVDVPGANRVYIVTVSRGTNANLASLAVSSGSLYPALSPQFDPELTFYSVTVGSAVGSISVTATVADEAATLEVNNSPASSGQPFGPINLQLGPNPPISIKVTALGATKTYSVVVTRSPNTNLAALQISAGILTPSLDPLRLDYAVTAPFATSATTVTATAADSFATLLINGQLASSGQPSPSINLPVGSTTITIIVSAPTVSPKTYTVVVTRLPASNNANLSNLAVTAGALNPTFTGNTLAYTVAAPNTTTSTTVTATVADPTATLTVNGVPTVSGVASAPLSLNPGANTLIVVVTPQSGAANAKTYTVTVTRAGNPNLSSLLVSAGPLVPNFNPNETGYTIGNVPSDTSNTTVTATVAEAGSTLTINGSAAISGAAFGPIPLTTGVNTIAIVVTAAGNVSRTYTIAVSVDQSANLASLEVSAGAFSPAFSPSVTGYSLSVPNTTASTTLTAAVVTPSAILEVNGVVTPSGIPSPSLNLSVGENTITIVVTPPVGASKTYTVTVNRAASSNANLSTLVVSAGGLSPVFAAGTTNYTVSTANTTLTTTVTATVADPSSTLSINSSPALSGASFGPLGLNVGPTTITIVVTPPSGAGDAKTYTVTVNRNSADLSFLAVSTGTVDLTLTPTFSSGQLTYAVTAPAATAQVIVTPAPAVLGTTVTVNGNPPATPVPLTGTTTLISVVATPSTGPPATTYTVTVTK